MGVHGLWELLAPVGRRVSVETLAGKKLAIDASIWMVQFIKAMRDDRGEMVRNAHLLGFFRRICKLLFLRTKPVFFFDGSTPAIKRRTLIARRRQRENAQAKVRKTAEKLLLNHLKATKLRELAENLQNQKQKRRKDVPKKMILPNHKGIIDTTSERDKGVTSCGSENLDEKLAASIVAEENEIFTSNVSTVTGATLAKENSDEEIILPAMNDIDPDVLSSLPSSIQHEVQKQKYKSESKDKKILSDGTHVVGSDQERIEVVSRSAYQKNLDEMLAASIAAEEAGSLNENASVSPVAHLDGEDPDDEDGEMILPEMHGLVDPSVLAALPPSVQLDLLVQMRERLMAENRQKYQRVKKDPEKFSELQIQAYLKTVAFRRDIDQVQKAAAGRGVGGVQTSRIASEANREFIFSSSFTGDKDILASTRAERNRDTDQQASRGKQPLSSLNNTEVPSIPNDLAQSISDKSTDVLDDNIETFLDERGRVRVSRVRAMGMHMTRDLERNLNLMKEIEKNTNASKVSNPKFMQNIEICNPRSFSSQSQVVETPHEGVSESIKLNERSGGYMLNDGTSIEILFEDDGVKSFDCDDDLFTRLVAENPLQMAYFDMSSQKLSPDGIMDSDWEEAVERKDYNPRKTDCDNSCKEGKVSDESDVEWEEGVCDHVINTVPYGTDLGKSVSKGTLEEEADLQEAIRRSLEDIGDTKADEPTVSEHEKSIPENMAEQCTDGTELGKSVSKGTLEEEADLQEAIRRSLEDIGDTKADPTVPEHEKTTTVGNIAEQCTDIQNENVIGLEKLNGADGMNSSQANDFTGSQGMTENLSQELQCSETVMLLDTKIHAVADGLDAANKDATLSGNESKENVDFVEPLSGDISSAFQVGDRKNNIVTEAPGHMVEKEGISTPHTNSSPNEFTGENCFKQNFPDDKGNSDLLLEENDAKKPAIEEHSNPEVEVTVDELTNRILFLEQERLSLGNEQKKLERNAESASNEMFVECQELLQMFGLPYIIAPMEAEAQCAYMELANLVDGVVTDDSDVFLFGARSVYKNIFDDRKYVETYYMKDVENELGLNRDKLIRMALLLGSDYTEGISGIGIVNAIEVVNAFPEEDGLHKFKEWIESPDPRILGKLDTQMGFGAWKRGSKVSENDMTCSNSTEKDVSASTQNISEELNQKESAGAIDVKQSFMDNHRNVSKNWHIPSGFPSEAVISAYSCPQVDKSAEPFSWGKPDHLVLRKLCWEKFGWDNQKADELLLPVLKEYSKHETQLRLEAFYTFNERFSKIRSKRIKRAIRSITGSQSAVLMDDSVKCVSVKEKSEPSVEPGDNIYEKCSSEIEVACLDEIENRLNKPSRKRQLHGEPSQSEKDLKLTMKEKGIRSRNKGRHKNMRDRGRGKGRGRGRVRLAPTGKAKGTPITELVETSTSDDENEYDDQEVGVENLPENHERRRSKRIRKSASYIMDDVEQPLDQSGERHSDDYAIDQDEVRDQHACVDTVIGQSEDMDLDLGTPKKTPHEEKTSHEDYLETGCSFYPAEDEMSQQGMRQEKDPSLEGNMCEDYLKMGGGFCLDEDDECVDPDVYHDLETVSEDPKDCSGDGPSQSTFSPPKYLGKVKNKEGEDACIDTALNVDDPNPTRNPNSLQVHEGMQEDAEDPVTASVGALSAMPNLRRKRRKY